MRPFFVPSVLLRPLLLLGKPHALPVVALTLMAALCTAPADAWAKPQVHTVYEGQRLGSIAKRYNVTVDELCKANNISARDPIKPGQKLIVPGTDDGSDSKSKSDGKSESKTEGNDNPQKPAGPAKVHVVAKGHTLGAISGRYAITVSAICNANDIERNTPLSVGQKLIIPHKTDKDGAYARRQRLRGHFDGDANDEDEKGSSKSNEKSWEKYVKPAWRAGYIKIRRYGRAWEGFVIGPKKEVLGHASNKINFVMGAKEDGPRIDPALIRLIASVSDKFGGRELRIVSGYRTKSFVAASKHKQGKAIDFSIPGVPNEALRDYLRTIKGVGVGYYPNSSFVHLDVRGYNSYWVDYSGPGQAPRKSKGVKKGESKEREQDDLDVSGQVEGEGDDEADQPNDDGSGDDDSKKKSSGPEAKQKGDDESSSNKPTEKDSASSKTKTKSPD